MSVQGLYCSVCRKTKIWDKLRPSYQFHSLRNVTERAWHCRDCGNLCKVETIETESKTV